MAKYICSYCGNIFNENKQTCASCTYNSDEVVDRTADMSCPIHACIGTLIPVDDLCIENIQILQKKGYKTLFSCSGHPYDDTGFPYISFTPDRHKIKPINSTIMNSVMNMIITELQNYRYSPIEDTYWISIVSDLDGINHAAYKVGGDGAYTFTIMLTEDATKRYNRMNTFDKMAIICNMNRLLHNIILVLPDVYTIVYTEKIVKNTITNDIKEAINCFTNDIVYYNLNPSYITTGSMPFHEGNHHSNLKEGKNND